MAHSENAILQELLSELDVICLQISNDNPNRNFQQAWRDIKRWKDRAITTVKSEFPGNAAKELADAGNFDTVSSGDFTTLEMEAERHRKILSELAASVPPRPPIKPLPDIGLTPSSNQTTEGKGPGAASPAPPPWYKTRRFTTGVAIAAVIIGLLYLLYRHKCPTLAVPKPHYVRQWKKPKIIIFVHGVLGDMDNTWINPQAHTSWPELVASDPKLTDYDVYVYGYQSSCEGDESNITEIANRFRANLIDSGFFSDYKEIYFIAHSMGGIITKRVLSSLNNPSEFDKLQRVRGVLLIAVPSAGAPIASVAGWLSTNPQFKNMDPKSSRAYLQAMENDWVSMLRNRTPGHPFPRAFVAYETKDIAGMRIVPELFTSQVSDATPIAFDYDHAAIVKPDSLTNEVYAWSKSRIVECSAYPTTGGGNAETANPTGQTPQEISGEVWDDEHGPLAGVSVNAAGVSTMTNSTGSFQIVLPVEKVPLHRQKVRLQVNRTGYESIDWLVSVPTQFATPIHLNKTSSNRNQPRN